MFESKIYKRVRIKAMILATDYYSSSLRILLVYGSFMIKVGYTF